MYERATELMEAELGDELVALEPQRGECFGFNSVATFVWQALREPKSFAQLRDALVEEYDVEPEQCSRELKDLLADLQAKGLVASTS
jgi:Coenzyme PQQ synthesis protein D (PqqD)